MSAWAITVIDGVLTGFGLYGLVRLRMYLGPIAGQRYGPWGRRAVWTALIIAMVVLAEIDLIWLRDWLEQNDAKGERWHYEAVFAFLILAVGLTLIVVRVLRRRAVAAPLPDDDNDGNSSSC